MNATITACVVALKTFTWPDLSHWNGLPSCTLADLDKVFTIPRDAGRGSGHLGEEHRPLAWLSASGGGFPDSIRVWLDGDRVVMMDSKTLAPRAALDALVAKIGAPAARLDSYFNNALLEGSEWVYPDRGLTLFVEPETHALLRVAAYPRTTLEEYRKNLRFMGGRRVR
jgi:hypothetical protein